MKEVYIQKIGEAIGEERLTNYASLLSRISEEYTNTHKNYKKAKGKLSTTDTLIPFTNREVKKEAQKLRLACNKLANSYFGMITDLKRTIQSQAESQHPFNIRFATQDLEHTLGNLKIRRPFRSHLPKNPLETVSISGLEEVQEAMLHFQTILSETHGNIYAQCPEREELIHWVLTDFLEKYKLPPSLEKFF